VPFCGPLALRQAPNAHEERGVPRQNSNSVCSGEYKDGPSWRAAADLDRQDLLVRMQVMNRLLDWLFPIRREALAEADELMETH
jgi:hypothetical protein